MKQKVGPVAITVAVVGLIVFLAVIYRVFFPPMPPPDMDNAKGMPLYAQGFLKNRNKPTSPPGSSGAPPQSNGAGSGH